ncbi:MAG: DUF6273 domain-containing protein [Oscillospiraceae bacterium]|nr:DUF6273 domain-containing protein [Oscillospiraceae bacterium]
MTFGGYDWLVLKTENDKALLITKDIIEQRAYNSKYTSVTWETCDLRAWLNSDFYNKFSDSEKAMIAETRLTNPDNPSYGTDGGNDTDDKVFLLSLDEVNRHFSSDDERMANYGNTWAWWWLRSPGHDDDRAAYVYGDGDVLVYGFDVDSGSGGVRPALWLDISDK